MNLWWDLSLANCLSKQVGGRKLGEFTEQPKMNEIKVGKLKFDEFCWLTIFAIIIKSCQTSAVYSTSFCFLKFSHTMLSFDYWLSTKIDWWKQFKMLDINNWISTFFEPTHTKLWWHTNGIKMLQQNTTLITDFECGITMGLQVTCVSGLI